MSEYLSAAAATMGLPEALVQRSAEARATETGASVDEVLQAWAGGGDVSAPAPEPKPAADTATEETVPSEETIEPEAVEAPAAAVIDTPEPSSGAAAPTRAPLPETVTPAAATRLPEVVTVPTAGIREKTSFTIPKWLTAVLLVAPLFALFALGGSATGECGEATELRVDVVTGDIVNCDGTEFTGQAVGGGGTNFIALGESAYPTCAGCHGPNGQGLGAFPALTGVNNTFGSCEDHIEWVTLGTGGFQAAGRSTYGDTGKQVGGAGNMPAFSGSLSAEQIAAVVAFERARFGGGEPDAVLTDCGLVEDAGAEGEPGEGAGGEGGSEASAGSSG